MTIRTKKFQKKVEDFVCANCGVEVKGNGYTDHCPYCLWSRHVDVNPGDRRSHCRGLMKPIGLKTERDNYIIYYRCLKCGFIHQVKAVSNDDIDQLIGLTGF